MIRKPAVGGRFYPNNHSKLNSMIEEYTSYKLNQKINNILGLILPHAGYIYSGKTQALGYKLLKEMDIETFIIIGSEHYKDTDYAAVLFDTELVLPNGKIYTDDPVIKRILENKNFKVDEDAHKFEHSIEVQLPFIIKFFPNSKIIPILTRCVDLKKLKEMADVICESIKNKKSFLIISTDLVHYPSYVDALMIDSETLNIIESFDEYSILNYEKNIVNQEKNIYCSMCGVSACLLGMLIMKNMGAKSIKSILYSNSFHYSSDSSRVVGYTTCGFFRDHLPETINTIEKVEEPPIIDYSKSVIKEKLGIKSRKPNIENFKCNGLFVTLKKEGKLRGCIGTIECTDFINALETYSINAAFYDPRFRPIRKEELEKLSIEVSIIKEIKKVDSIFNIKRNSGVIIKNGSKKGVFLPSVWGELKNRAVFLTTLAFEKALLEPYMIFEDNTEIFTFDVKTVV
ncbi:MAG: AmmeMemoRadiSam system protein B [bacterium]|nr:AmmeMemoRadiSam system protein B [bacterium]